jgi:hypothetical protein
MLEQVSQYRHYRNIKTGNIYIMFGRSPNTQRVQRSCLLFTLMVARMSFGLDRWSCLERSLRSKNHK